MLLSGRCGRKVIADVDCVSSSGTWPSKLLLCTGCLALRFCRIVWSDWERLSVNSLQYQQQDWMQPTIITPILEAINPLAIEGGLNVIRIGLSKDKLQ